ncbi:glycosyltransferase family 2 protein [Streptacidiphilus sp. P02-A3a]|uniref:glycosyltransferase family 2 protein n=1 Tax=Streptacidiphilus sp. P02-A3a TaxID=2704468 RepID=UPI0015FCFF0B|nr:glycosyltransferase family 2 protein [Streptacidiphilus sp. P02-A3a]QMU71969.1 glycosyltransferase family 2 protein [Streptacidiphilus sp. P02-A3a]
MPDDVSVIICGYTEDRWDDLLAAVDSALKQSLPPLEVLVVVDHNPRLLTRLRARLVGTEPVQVIANSHARGLSGGRNTGVAAARGGIVAFLDDDAVAERDWLRWFADGFADPEVMGVGGLTLPVWDSGRRPGWYPQEFDWVHGATYRGMPTGRARVRNVLGGNASFRRGVFESVGGFSAGIGRGADAGGDGRPVRPLGGEETELCIRIHQERPGSVFLFDDRSVIHHRVPIERQRFGYFRTRCWAEGLSKAQVAGRVGAGDGLSSERYYASRTLPAGILRGLAETLRGDVAGLARAAAITSGGLITAVGYVLGSWQLRANSDRGNHR